MQNDMREFKAWVDKKYQEEQTRDRLVELLIDSVRYTYENQAEYLIANGVVSVVRCKNCIFANDYGTICRYGVGRQVEPEHYCSYGERKEE